MEKEKKQMHIDVDKEYKRMKQLFKNIPNEKLKIVDGLLRQSARLKVGLDYAWRDIEKNGEYDLYYNSPDAPGMERERPVAKIFTQRHGAYQKTIGDLIRLLPEDVAEEVKSQFDSSDLT